MTTMARIKSPEETARTTVETFRQRLSKYPWDFIPIGGSFEIDVASLRAGREAVRRANKISKVAKAGKVFVLKPCIVYDHDFNQQTGFHVVRRA